MPVSVTCRVLGFSRQGDYSWLAVPVSDRDLVDAYATNAAIDAHGDDPEFGYRFIADELAEAGHQVSERRVRRLCSAAGLFSVHSVKRGKGCRPGPPVHDDLACRNFTAPAPNRLWLTAGIQAIEGKVYCCAVKDVFSNRIVGYSISCQRRAKTDCCPAPEGQFSRGIDSRNPHVGKHFTVVGDDVEPRDAVVSRICPDRKQVDIDPGPDPGPTRPRWPPHHHRCGGHTHRRSPAAATRPSRRRLSRTVGA